MAEPAVWPVRMRLDRPNKTFHIEWSDGLRHTYPLDYLRGQCPSATAKVERAEAEADSLHVLKRVPSSEVVTIEPVGNYAISFHWADGHHAGIYTWEYLREIAASEHVIEEGP